MPVAVTVFPGNGDRLAPTKITAVLEPAEFSSTGPTLQSAEVIALIRKMSQVKSATHSWELLKLGFELSEATVAKYMVHHRKPTPQPGARSWQTI